MCNGIQSNKSLPINIQMSSDNLFIYFLKVYSNYIIFVTFSIGIACNSYSIHSRFFFIFIPFLVFCTLSLLFYETNLITKIIVMSMIGWIWILSIYFIYSYFKSKKEYNFWMIRNTIINEYSRNATIKLFRL